MLTYDHAAQGRQSHVVLTGNPCALACSPQPRRGPCRFGVPEDARMLRFRGSLGAPISTRPSFSAEDMLLGYPDLHIVHVTGPKELDSVTECRLLTERRQARAGTLWRATPIRWALTMAAADAIVSRAGATSFAEISARSYRRCLCRSRTPPKTIRP